MFGSILRPGLRRYSVTLLSLLPLRTFDFLVSSKLLTKLFIRLSWVNMSLFSILYIIIILCVRLLTWSSETLLSYTACLQAYNLPRTIRQISIGYQLITGDLPAYNLPCSVSPVWPNYVWRDARLPCVNGQMHCAFPQLQPVWIRAGFVSVFGVSIGIQYFPWYFSCRFGIQYWYF